MVLRKLSVLVLSVLLIWGCAQPMSQTQKGAAVGTGVGAAVGAGLGQAIGGDTKATLIGAGIGAAVGAMAGGGIGRYMDNQEKALRQSFAASEAANIQRNADLLAVTFKSDMLFDVDSATIKPGAAPEINRVADVLVNYPLTTILIAGHTDSTGSESYNQGLSERRALSVHNALLNQGVAAQRMTTVGYGETQPIADNTTASGRQLNRRVVVTITPQ
ncbi:MAG: OmpA family protein [Desulfuromonadales bacterium]|nr:OmpA family protein [Desulfuromonadales bacterium]